MVLVESLQLKDIGRAEYHQHIDERRACISGQYHQVARCKWMKKMGPSTESCGTPQAKGFDSELELATNTYWYLNDGYETTQSKTYPPSLTLFLILDSKS